MATFCASCGSPLADGTRFCEKCGAAVANPPAPVVAPVASSTPGSPAPMAPKGSSTAVKVIIAILAVIMFIILLVAGSCVYVAYRVKQKAREFTKEMENTTPYTGKREPCAMLTAEEAGTALGQPVSSAEAYGSTVCRYTYGSDNSKQFSVQYTWQGGAITMGITRGAMKHISGMQTFTQVDGVGDEAVLAPMDSALMMRKGDVLVNMDLRTSGVPAAAAKKMAEIIADRL